MKKSTADVSMYSDFQWVNKILNEEIQQLDDEAKQIEIELAEQFKSLIDNNTTSSTFQNTEAINPILENLQQNTLKMYQQVEGCKNLSERLSSLVRQLDSKQMRAQKTLSITEDILNLKVSNIIGDIFNI